MIQAEKMGQIVFKSLKHSLFDKKEKMTLPKEYQALYHLIPTSNKSVGHDVPDELFEEQAIPVPKELRETAIPWANYNFYSVGS
jgi:hypothetical protein